MSEKTKITRRALWSEIYREEYSSRHERAPEPTVEFIDRKVEEAINSGLYEIIPESVNETKREPKVPAKEKLKEYHSGSSWVARLAHQSKLIFNRLLGKDGRK